MSHHRFKYEDILSDADRNTALMVLGWDRSGFRDPGLCSLDRARDRLRYPNAVVSTDDGEPIMYRWHLVPRNDFANVYFHIQVRDDDPGRGPHDHMYNSHATILAGAYYDDLYAAVTPAGKPGRCALLTSNRYKAGDIVERDAKQLHMIRLAEDCPYTMTIFSTGPRYRAWGFVDPDGKWHPAEAKGDLVNGVVVAKGRSAT